MILRTLTLDHLRGMQAWYIRSITEQDRDRVNCVRHFSDPVRHAIALAGLVVQ